MKNRHETVTKKRRTAGLTRRDGMQYNYQLNSFRAHKNVELLSTFFADEYVNRYVVKVMQLQKFFK